MRTSKLCFIPAILLVALFFGCDLNNDPPDPAPQEIVHPLVNSDFETGDLSGWTVETGNAQIRTSSPDPHQGTYYIFGNSTPEFILSQEVDLIGAGLGTDDIDGGLVTFQVDGYRASWESSPPIDEGEFQLRFKDENRNVIIVANSGLEAITPEFTWVYRSLQNSIPAGTRYVDVILRGYRRSGSNCDGYFDQISARSIIP